MKIHYAIILYYFEVFMEPFSQNPSLRVCCSRVTETGPMETTMFFAGSLKLAASIPGQQGEWNQNRLHRCTNEAHKN